MADALEPGLILIIVVNGYALACGTWPCRQWVKHQLWEEGLDAEEIERALPSWKHGYRALRVGGYGQIP